MEMAEQARKMSEPAQPAQNGRAELLANAGKQLQAGESLFDIAKYPALLMRPIESECQSLTDHGISPDVLKGGNGVPAQVTERARKVIYTSDGKAYRNRADIWWPALRPEAYATPDSIVEALAQWLKAIPEFNRASVVVGKTAFMRKTHNVDGSKHGESASDPSVLLRDALHKGIDLRLQGSVYQDVVKPMAEAAARAEGFSPQAGTPKKRVEAQTREV